MATPFILHANRENHFYGPKSHTMAAAWRLKLKEGSMGERVSNRKGGAIP